jgi:hypothetical protein
VISGLSGEALGGNLHGSGSLRTGDKPVYTLQGYFEKLNPMAVGQLVGLHCSGGVLTADGKIELSGFAEKDLASSAKGTLHFEWRRGAVSGGAGQGSTQSEPSADLGASATVPPTLARFDRWTADGDISNGKITFKQDEVQQGSRKRAVEVAVTLGDRPAVTFASLDLAVAKKR